MAKATKKTATKEKTLPTIGEDCVSLVKLQGATKGMYAKMDAIKRRLIAACKAQEDHRIDLGDGHYVRLKDNFIDADGCEKIVSFKPCGVERWTIDVA